MCARAALLKHVLRNRQGLRVAVIVNDISEVLAVSDVDAMKVCGTCACRMSLECVRVFASVCVCVYSFLYLLFFFFSPKGGGAALSRVDEKMVEMPNGCICCTLRQDLMVNID